MAEDDRSSRFALRVLPHLSSAYRLARWLTRSHEDAEEVVQDACLNAFRARDDLRGADARAWLLAIVRHASYALLRQRQQLPAHEPWDDETDDPGQRTVHDDGLVVSDPQMLLLRREDAARLNAAVAALPTIFREVLVLREFEGMSYAEIAALIGVPTGTVMSRLARARRQLLCSLRGGDGAV